MRLFCNAGYGQVGAVEDIPRMPCTSNSTPMCSALKCITHAMKIFRQAGGRGRVLINSSILGFAAMPWRGGNSSKFALEGLADTLRHETHGSAIFVSLIEPGPIATRFRPNALEKFKQYIDIDKSMHAESYRAQLARLKPKATPRRLP